MLKQPDGHRGRVQLDVDVRCASTIVLPLNQLSNQAIICETAALRINNQFKFANSILLFEEHSIENQYGIGKGLFFILIRHFQFLAEKLFLLFQSDSAKLFFKNIVTVSNLSVSLW